jgi:hypothetical protein
MEVDPAADQLRLGLRFGATASLELGLSSTDSTALLRGRKIVYLDQNLWSAIAAWRHRHRDVSAADAAAARRLTDLVADDHLVLPFSSGHLVETTPLYGVRRAALASTILEFSRGWQMVNPARIRHREMVRSAQEFDPRVDGVFGLDEKSLLSTEAEQAPTTTAPNPAIGRAHEKLTSLTSVAATLLDPERLDPTAGKLAAQRWADVYAEFSRWLAQAALSREQALEQTHVAVMLDLTNERIAAETTAITSDWAARSFAAVALMPSVGRYRAVLFARLRNGGRWRPNDFLDVLFLCAAAGYADVVAGESRTIGDLRTAQRITPGAKLARTLTEAVDLLESPVILTR